MNIKQRLLTLAAAAIAVTTASAGGTNSVPNWGTDILHYFVRDRFTNNGGEPLAKASVDMQFKSQGNTEQQKFNLTVRQLTPTTSYRLLSLERGETNYSDAVEFATDVAGNASVSFKGSQSGNVVSKPGNGKGHGKGQSQPLPDALDPIYQLDSLVVVDVNTQAVLQADLTAPDRLLYLVKRKLDGDSASGVLRLKGNLKSLHFNLQAVNLAPTTDYWLAINETVVQTNRSDALGKLKINAFTTPVSSPLDIQKVQLLDIATNVLLSTELP